MKTPVMTMLVALLALSSTVAEAQDVIDAAVYRIFFVTPEEGDKVRSPVKFTLEITGGFLVNRAEACSPAGTCYGQYPELRVDDTGHCHIYVEDEQGDLAGFSAACAVDGMTMALAPGRYCAFADLTHNDHVARFKPGPQALPPFDKICFEVKKSKGWST